MKTSVVIPAFNAERTIRRAIDSVLEQNLLPFEIIVVDDGSTDSTKELAESYGGITKCISQCNAGVSTARNVGIDAAKGEWIAFLDADDVWFPDRLRLQSEIVQRHPGLAWCSGAYEEQRENAESHDRDNIVISVDASIEGVVADAVAELGRSTNHWNGVVFWTGTISVRAAALREVRDPAFGSYFDTQQRSSQDVDLWLRLAARFPQLGYCEQPIARHHIGNAISLTGEQSIGDDGSIVLFAKRGYDLARRMDPHRSQHLRNFVDKLSHHTCKNAYMSGHIEHGKWLTREYLKLGVPLPTYLSAFRSLPTWCDSTLVRMWRNLRPAR